MSSGGMDWAYRMIALHDLDPLGGMIVMHLGWRDSPDQRTDRGIARALNQHRSAVQKATAKLVADGIICRRSGQWVAVETVRIVEQSPDAPRPSAAADDARPTQWAGGGPLSGPHVAHSVGPKRKEKIEKGRAAPARSVSPPRRPPLRSGGGASVEVGKLTAFERSRIEAGQSVTVGGVMLLPGSPDAERLRMALRSDFAENGARM